MAHKSSGIRAQKRNTTKSLMIFKAGEKRWFGHVVRANGTLANTVLQAKFRGNDLEQDQGWKMKTELTVLSTVPLPSCWLVRTCWDPSAGSWRRSSRDSARSRRSSCWWRRSWESAASGRPRAWQRCRRAGNPSPCSRARSFSIDARSPRWCNTERRDVSERYRKVKMPTKSSVPLKIQLHGDLIVQLCDICHRSLCKWVWGEEEISSHFNLIKN